MLLAEDLLLLLTDDETGKFAVDGNQLNLALAGTCVLELAQRGQIDVAAKGEAVKKGRLVVRDDAPTGDPVLDDVLARCGDREGAKPQDVLSKLAKNVRERLLDRLTEHGILRRDEGRVLGIFPITRWPAEDSEHERGVAERLQQVLVQGLTPDDRTAALAALAALLSSLDAAHKVVPSNDKKAVRRRAKELREGEWAPESVSKAIKDVQAAVMVAMFVPATFGAGST